MKNKYKYLSITMNILKKEKKKKEREIVNHNRHVISLGK